MNESVKKYPKLLLLTLNSFILCFFVFLVILYPVLQDKQQAAIDFNGIRNSRGIWLMAAQINCYQCGQLIEPLELGKLFPVGRSWTNLMSWLHDFIFISVSNTIWS